MAQEKRFQDENFRLTDFYHNVLVVCPSCKNQADANVDFELQKAKLLCKSCFYSKSTAILFGPKAQLHMAAHGYFHAELWLQAPFKNEIFWAYNQAHLQYLEQYIGATLREHKDRTHFTLLEKLPKFYHEAKNRSALLKLIKKLKMVL
jgi:hypothetical protein